MRTGWSWKARTLVGIVWALAILAMPAQAFATRYVTPSGTSGQNCQTVLTGCDLKTAIEGTGGNMPSPGEEVIIEPGSYSLSTSVTEGASNLNIHGVLDQPRPVINESGPAFFVIYSSTVSYLDIESTTPNDFNLVGGMIDRVFMRAAELTDSPVCQCYGGTVRNSVIVSTGLGPALGVLANGASSTPTYRNVTAYTTNSSAPAIQVKQIGASGTNAIDAYNVIARNGAGGLAVVASGPGTTITFHHSNHGAASGVNTGMVMDADPNQAAAPLFTNAAAGDFSELAGSPTIDTGLHDALNGTTDFAGNPRTVGAETDIGAFEFVPPGPPGPPTPPATTTPSSGPTTNVCTRGTRSAAEAKKKKKKRGCAPKKKRKKHR